MSNFYYNKNKERISNIKSLILKGSNNNLNIKSRNIKINVLGKFISNLENDFSQRSEYNIKKLSLIDKTCNTTTGHEENNKIPKIRNIIYVNGVKNSKSLSKENKNKRNDISFKKSKLITVNKMENMIIHQNKNLLKQYMDQCKIQRPLSTISDIKLKKIKILGSKDKNVKKKYINKCIIKQWQKMNHSRNIENSNIISDNIKDNVMHNLTQRNIFNHHNHRNVFLSLKHKLKDKINTSRNENISEDSRKLTDGILNHTKYLTNKCKVSKDNEKKYYYNTLDEEDLNINKRGLTLLKYNDFNKKCVVSLVKPAKKIMNKALPDRDKILDSIHINKFNSNNYFLPKYKQKTSNTLYKIPLAIKKKIKNKLNNTITLIKNKKNNSISADKKENKRQENSISNKKINKINITSNKSKITSKFNSKLLLNSISKAESINQNLFSPTTSITKENTITMKDIITKKIMKIDSCTIAGYSSPGIQKINQDNFFIIKEFLGDEEQFFLGVCDGHGTYGHLVSEYISKKMPTYLKNSSDESIINSFKLTNKSLLSNSKIDCSLSGSTCTTLIINLEKIICSNLGDSRAVLGRYENGIYNAVNLSNDHKPSDPVEMKRILLNGGRIQPFYDVQLKKFLGPERVWLKNSDIPGLAMTRSFGDNVAHSVGVITDPEIIKYEFLGNEKFIILASDGIWEYIDSDECVNIIKDFYENDMDAIGALNSLVKEAFNRWKNMEDSMDDITAIVIFFE